MLAYITTENKHYVQHVNTYTVLFFPSLIVHGLTAQNLIVYIIVLYSTSNSTRKEKKKKNICKQFLLYKIVKFND